MQSLPNERKRNQRKSPLTPKKTFRKEDSPPAMVRVGGRVKKAKIPFDPSDAVTKRRQTDPYLPMKRFSGKDGPVVQQNCCHCKKCDKPEILVSCKGDGCTTKIHIDCLQSISEHFGKNEDLSWQCYSCQSCIVCSKSVANGKPLLKCYICFSYYHPKCHGAEDKIKIVKENRFFCGCDKSRSKTNTPPNAAKVTAQKKTRAFSQTRVKPASTDNKFSSDGKIGFLGFNANEVIESSSSESDEANESTQSLPHHSRPARSQMQNLSSTDNRSSIDDDISTFDATEWSTDQVFKYFKNKFPRHAHVFKDHEIDGSSLYLLKRGDVVKGFNIKLGPALKIYGHILAIQTKSNNPRLSWH